MAAHAPAAEVRDHVLAQHAELRKRLDEICALANRFESGDASVGANLRQRGLALYERFAEHLDFEEAQLEPLLRAREVGRRHADHLLREHQEQRELLQYLLGRLSRQPLPTLLVARELRNFAEYVRLDMAHEEKTLLDEALLGLR